MLTGNWKNFDELEESLSYPELKAIITALREQEQRRMKFEAALQGVDLDKNKEPEYDPVEMAKLRVKAKIEGTDVESLRFSEAASAAGFRVEVQE